MGQSVPSVKDNVSPDFINNRLHYRAMDQWLSEEQFNDSLCARIQRLREERGWQQKQMAAAIGVPFERYKKYETRSPIPAYLIPRFAQMVDRDVAYVLTGVAADTRRAKVRELVRVTGTDG